LTLLKDKTGKALILKLSVLPRRVTWVIAGL
jgi:hypothetical protein